MRTRWPALIALGVALSASSLAFAGDDTKAETKNQSKSAKDRKDPKGVQGISPMMELINEGNAAYVARDYAAATAKYQEAIQKEPNHPLGHYLLGQAFVAEGKLDDAGSAWQNALRFAEQQPVLKAKALFVLADLRERQQRWDDAATAWKAYADFVAANPNAKGYPATPTERQKAIETRKDVESKYAAVKERIAQRERDAAAKAK